jgi:hypothetical protein
VPTASQPIPGRLDCTLPLPHRLLRLTLLAGCARPITDSPTQKGLHQYRFTLTVDGALTLWFFRLSLAPASLTQNDMTGALRTVASDINLMFQFLGNEPALITARLRRSALMDWLHAESYVEFPSQALSMADHLLALWASLSTLLRETQPPMTPRMPIADFTAELRALATGILALPWQSPCILRDNVKVSCHV